MALTGKFCSTTMFVLLLLLILAWLYLFWKKERKLHSVSEAFTQDSPFVISSNSDIYDDFYAEIYDSLMLSDERAAHFWSAFTKAVQPFQHARFLDVGSGTGAMVDRVADSGFHCIGVDSSEAMIRFSQSLYPTRTFLHTCVMDPMLFERNEFFSVFCLGMTIYEFSDEQKLQFFKNCYFWIRPGGYLLLHLADPDHFSPLVPSAVPFYLSSSSSSSPRLLNYDIEFDGFSYQQSLENHASSSSCVRRCESFTDHSSSSVRQNEFLLHMTSTPEILQLGQRAGFVVAGLWNLKSSVYQDPDQFLYLLERTL